MASTQYTTGQSPSRDCLSVHVTLAFRPEDSADHIIVPVGVDGLSLAAYRFNTYAGQAVRETSYTAKPDSKVHLFKSPYKSLYFITTFSQYSQRGDCSCGVWFCDHVRQLRGLEVRS